MSVPGTRMTKMTQVICERQENVSSGQDLTCWFKLLQLGNQKLVLKSVMAQEILCQT